MQEESKSVSQDFFHLPVLADELLEMISHLPESLLSQGLCVDATLGGGGHSSMILEAHPQLRVIGVDQDPVARASAAQRLKHFEARMEIVAGNFADFMPKEPVAVVVADLGVSSPQLDVASRGFSFLKDGPIDMRMNPEVGETAAELIERLQETELAEIIYRYGEERFSRRIARRIKHDLRHQGPYKGTASLAYAVAGCYPPKMRHARIHPATRTFQALRIVINNELEVLNSFLEQSPEWLLPGGLLCVVSFHSLEDRCVKNAFLKDNRLERITKKPLMAKDKEIASNPRSRSAKCRVARRRIS